MKKISFSLVVVLLISLLAGCAPSGNQAPAVNNASPASNNTVSDPGNTENTADAAVSTDNTVNTSGSVNTNTDNNSNTNSNTNTGTNTNTNTSPAVPSGTTDPLKLEEPYASGFKDEEDTLDFLNGTWIMISKGEFASYDPETSPRLIFSSSDKTLTYSPGTGSSHVKCGIDSIGRLFDSSSSPDLMSLIIEEASEDLTSHMPYFVGTMCDFQILAANVWNDDCLIMRGIGNGDSLFGQYALGSDNLTEEGFWVFKRADDETRKAVEISDSQNSGLLEKGKSFYAIRWLEFTDSVYLQKVSETVTEQILVDDPIETLEYTYSANGHALIAPCYQLKGVQAGNGEGRFRPDLVYVTTDENGEILEIQFRSQLPYGYYQPDDAVPFDPETAAKERAEDYYGATDKIFLGIWKLKDDENSQLEIVADSPQVGGYKLIFSFYGKGTAECFANRGGGGLDINQGNINGYDFYGHLEEIDGGILFRVTESGYEVIPPRSEFTFVK